MPFLRALPAASIHLIATDPPFNKRRNFYSRANGDGFRDVWSWKSHIEPASIAQLRARHTTLGAVFAAARLIRAEAWTLTSCWLAHGLLELVYTVDV